MKIRDKWPRTSRTNDTGDLCGIEFKGEEDTRYLTSGPFGTRDPFGQLGQATVDLTGDIQYTFGPEFDAAMGTDENPLVLRFDMCGGVPSNLHVQYDIGYMELFLDTGQPNQNRAPMDHVLVGEEEDPINNPGCISCFNTCEPDQDPSVHVPWPFVWQSYEDRPETPVSASPPLQTNVRTAIAVGCNALLDNNPCHCETSANQKPRNEYLSFYDGLMWRVINPLHPGPGGETLEWWTDGVPADANYFRLGGKNNTVTLTIKRDTVDIALRTKISGDWVQCTVTGIKRQYLGEFNKLHGGAAIGCELDNNGNCDGNRKCMSLSYDRCDGGGKTQDGHKWLVFDGVAVAGGRGAVQEGACCLADGSCDVMLPDPCADAGGLFGGPGTICDESSCRGACCLPTSDCVETEHNACPGEFQGLQTDCAAADCPCPTPFADGDVDGDVDQEDFAVMQECFTGPGPTTVVGQCECFDRDNGGTGDDDVDTDDYAAFEVCATGPGVPVIPCE